MIFVCFFGFVLEFSLILVIFADEAFPSSGGCEVKSRQNVIVGSYSSVKEAFEVLRLYLFCQYTALFSSYLTTDCFRPYTSNVCECFILVFRNLVCQLLLMCLYYYYYYYKYVRLVKRSSISFASARLRQKQVYTNCNFTAA